MSVIIKKRKNHPTSTSRVIVGYYTSRSIYERKYNVEDIPVKKLTHINYAFMNVASDGSVVYGDAHADRDINFPKFRQLKVDCPGLVTLLSVGGWTFSKYFSNAASTPESRARFARTAIALMREGGFDGIDIDWEHPGGGGMRGNINRPEDPHNFTLLLQEVRKQLDRAGKNDGREYHLTIAVAGIEDVMKRFEISEILKYVDFISVMTYDFHFLSDPLTNFNSPLYASSDDPSPEPMRSEYNCDFAMQYWVSKGVPASKLVMGLPFYGRGYAGVPPNNNGLFQPFSGLPQGTWEPGAFDYMDLAQNYLNKSSYTRHWHLEAKVPWLYSPDVGVMISYDDPESIRIKCEYIKANGFAGAMMWELSCDGGVLLDVVHSRLG
jgi:chitinase